MADHGGGWEEHFWQSVRVEERLKESPKKVAEHDKRLGNADDGTGIEGWKRRTKERLAKINDAEKALSYAPGDRATLMGAGERLAKARERRLRQLDLLEELHDNILRQKKLEQDLAKRLGNKDIPLESKNTLVTSTDEKIWAFYEQEDPAWEELHLLDGVIPTLAPEQEIDTAIATSPH